MYHAFVVKTGVDVRQYLPLLHLRRVMILVNTLFAVQVTYAIMVVAFVKENDKRMCGHMYLGYIILLTGSNNQLLKRCDTPRYGESYNVFSLSL